MKRVLAQVKKELTQLWRDKFTLSLALVLPVILLLLLSNATSLTVKGIPVAVKYCTSTASIPIRKTPGNKINNCMETSLKAAP